MIRRDQDKIQMAMILLLSTKSFNMLKIFFANQELDFEPCLDFFFALSGLNQGLE